MGLVGSTKQPGYAASKHAVVGLTKTAALCWAGEKIRVNAVCPGAVRTVMTEASMSISPQIRARLMSMSPMGRLAEASEIAEAALWLCSERSSFVNGVALAVDGGFTAG
jgi:NAD(P)-dependent dehydrogenase (short-subunit alcohol dehydrogenase family)